MIDLVAWIVDDSPLEAELVRRALGPRIQTQLFADGEAMLDRLFSSAGPDVLLLDWHLPGVSGVEICKLVRATRDELSLPILLMTGSGEVEPVVVGLNAGANDFLTKPIQSAELVARVRTLLRVRQLHRELDSASRALRQRVEFEEQLVGIVSHDLRNPLEVIRTSTALLQRQPEPGPAWERGLARISRAADRSNRLIRDLLDFTRARLGGGIPVQRTHADVHALAQQCVEEAQLTSGGRTIRSHVSGDGQCEVDLDRVTQLLSNLVDNALKYGAPDSAVEVYSEGRPDGVELRVTNQGAPIPHATLSTLFEPMRRGEGQIDTAARSIGLGLYIVREIVRSHHGRVDARSSPEEGTTFTVWLPRLASSSGRANGLGRSGR